MSATRWGRALVAAVERDGDRGRLARGQDYARAGRVTALRLTAAGATAEVQGTRPEPFHTLLRLPPVDRSRLVATVRETPGLLAALVGGALPAELGPLLAPSGRAEVEFVCDCPDFRWPCLHAAALTYAAGERLDERPGELLVLRGVEIDELIGAVERDRDGAGPLPALPDPPVRAAIELLDPLPLRRALRLIDGSEASVVAAQRELRALYAALICGTVPLS
jgi:uncharacterized Zn finger protein